MGTRDSENALVAVQLTVDLKPNLPGRMIVPYVDVCCCPVDVCCFPVDV